MLTDLDKPPLSGSRPWQGPVAVVLEVLAAIGVLVSLGYTFSMLSALPAEIPSHFNLLGEPDAWTQNTGVVLILPAVAVLIYALCTLAVRYPHRMKYPWAITAENATSSYRMTHQIVLIEKVVIVWMLAYLSWTTIQSALSGGDVINESILFGFIFLAVFAPGVILVSHFSAISKRNATPHEVS